MDSDRLNVADRLARVAALMPEGVAVATPGRGDVAGTHSYATCTFRELDDDATALARGLVERGVRPGTRLVLGVPPGIEFVKLVFALLRSGATTVLVDPGMGRKHLVNCLAAAEPEGFVAVSRAQAVRTFMRRRFPKSQLNVTVGRRWFWGGATYKQLLQRGRASSGELAATRADDAAAIIFTSGSTGPPKGVLYTHRMFDTQASEIQRAYDIQPGGADLACFALFGLFNSAMGVTTVFPSMDFSRPASADVGKLLAAASDWRVTQAFASPAVWDKVSQHCEATGETIPSLRKVFSCGAPVRAEVIARTLKCVAKGAEMHTPYGATEALPVATIEAKEILSETAAMTAKGAGVCVGRKFDSVEWRVIGISDGTIESIDQAVELAAGEIGELIVRGPQVSPNYVVGNDEIRMTDDGWSERNSSFVIRHSSFNAVAKINDGATTWHRMGDVGYLDARDRFWYCGRKAHRVESRGSSVFSVPMEEVFNAHPRVKRSAVVGCGANGEAAPVLVVELMDGDTGRDASRADDVLAAELRTLRDAHAPQNETLRLIDLNRVLVHPRFPVDVRHNSKINREELAAWATRELGGDGPRG